VSGAHRRNLAVILVAVLLAAACGSTEPSGGPPDEIVLLTHESFALSEGTLDAFAESTGVTVVVQTAGDAGSMVNEAILTKDNPIADVMYGIDNAFLSRAIDEGLFVPHEAGDIGSVPRELRVRDDLATPIDYGDVCVNHDLEALAALGLSPPTGLDDLIDPAYRDLLVVEDPATSSPGLAFLIATITEYPEGSAYDWRDYWQDLFANGVSVSSDWSSAYYGEFTRAGGSRPLVVSYASSPPAEVFFGNLASAPTGAMSRGCFRQVEYAAVLAGTEYPDTAGQLVDFLLSRPVQEDIPLNMFVYPANAEATLPDVFIAYTEFPDEPAVLDPDTIDANRERWIQEWTSIARS
jgi:thiamine transport system substrate-binding protein